MSWGHVFHLWCLAWLLQVETVLTLDFHLGSSRQLSRVIMTEHSGLHGKMSIKDFQFEMYKR